MRPGSSFLRGGLDELAKGKKLTVLHDMCKNVLPWIQQMYLHHLGRIALPCKTTRNTEQPENQSK